MAERVLRGAIFYGDETPRIGTLVRIEREGDDGAPYLVQVHYLANTEQYRSKRRDREVTLFCWETHCTECGDELEYKSRNATKYLKRRCPICNEENPYDPRGWSTRKRNRYIRVEPEPEEVDPATLF